MHVCTYAGRVACLNTCCACLLAGTYNGATYNSLTLCGTNELYGWMTDALAQAVSYRTVPGSAREAQVWLPWSARTGAQTGRTGPLVTHVKGRAGQANRLPRLVNTLYESSGRRR
jgi:hypothetical protein